MQVERLTFPKKKFVFLAILIPAHCFFSSMTLILGLDLVVLGNNIKFDIGKVT